MTTLGISFQRYDGGPAASAQQSPDEPPAAVGALVYVTAMTAAGFVVTTDATDRRPLGVVTQAPHQAGDPVRVQTDGTVTLTGLTAGQRDVELAIGNSIAWNADGTLLADHPHPAGYVLHRTATTVRVQLIHSP